MDFCGSIFNYINGGINVDKINILQYINLGNSVAEFDKNLKDYFVATPSLTEIISDRWDIVRGTKGSGKSAILLTLFEKQSAFPELSDTILILATNHLGDPVFKTAFSNTAIVLDEQKLIDAWKVYLINVIWPDIKKNICSNEIEAYLIKKKLISPPEGLLEKIQYSIKRIFNPKSIKTSLQDQFGTTYTAEVDLSEDASDESYVVDFNYIFSTFDSLLTSLNKRLWVLMDRLDDAFPGNPTLENAALKSLLYAYKDLAGYNKLKIKIFMRDDIYDRITKNGFRSLTHVNTNAMPPIKWTEEKLLHLVCERLIFNEKFREYLLESGYTPKDIVSNVDREILLLILFRDQVDIGPKSPTTFRWILNHLEDGKGNTTPRDVIALIDRARIYQSEALSINPMLDEPYLIGPNAIKNAWSIVSKDKLEVQLYAEYPHLKSYMLKFASGKAEHNATTLEKLLGSKWKEIVDELINIGFIERLSNSWKIPFIYRAALGITQGKAFDTSISSNDNTSLF